MNRDGKGPDGMGMGVAAQGGWWLSALVLASLLAGLLLAAPAVAGAQAAGETRLSFQIAAGPLDRALEQLAEQSGLQLVYRPDQVQGVSVPALQGGWTVEAALRQLLQGSGLRHRYVGEGTVTLEAVPPAATGSSVPATPAARAIEEVVVTARRREERQQDVPLAITAVSGRFLEDNAVTRLADLTAYVPALQVDNFNSPTTTNIGVRGVRSTDIAPGQDSAVGVYFGEVNYAYTVGISQLLFDLQAVEVLKGPQGTLFGRNSTGGAMLLTPARPTQDTDYRFSVGSRFFDGGMGYSSEGMVNLPLGSTLAMRAAFRVIDRDGYVADRSDRDDPLAFTPNPSPSFPGSRGRRLDADRSGAWRLGLRWTPTADISSDFMAQGVRVDTSGIAYALTAMNPAGFAAAIFNGQNGMPSAMDNFQRINARQARDPWTAETNIGGFVELDMQAYSNITEWRLSERLLLKNVIGYRRYERHDGIDFDGMPLSVLEVQHPDSGREFSEELQLQGSHFDGALDWVLGVFHATQSIERRSSQVLFGGDEQFTWVDSDNRSSAAFAQATWRLPAVERLSVTAGLRYTRDRREMTNRRFTDNACMLSQGGAPLAQSACAFHGATRYGETTYSLGVDYRLAGGALLYVAHRRGYRAGGFDYAAAHAEVYGPFQPEFVTDYELGVKHDWQLAGMPVRSNLALYHQRYDDIQRFILRDDQPAASVTNAASATISGAELEVMLSPYDGFDVSLSYARLVAGYDDFGPFTDNEMAQAPRHQGAIALRHRLPLPEGWGDARLRADWSYRSRIFHTDTAQGPAFGPLDSQGQAGHGLLNIGLNWDEVMDSRVDLALFVRNVTERATRPFGVQLYGSLGYNLATLGEPRVVGFELTYRLR